MVPGLAAGMQHDIADISACINDERAVQCKPEFNAIGMSKLLDSPASSITSRSSRMRKASLANRRRVADRGKPLPSGTSLEG